MCRKDRSAFDLVLTVHILPPSLGTRSNETWCWRFKCGTNSESNWIDAIEYSGHVHLFLPCTCVRLCVCAHVGWSWDGREEINAVSYGLWESENMRIFLWYNLKENRKLHIQAYSIPLPFEILKLLVYLFSTFECSDDMRCAWAPRPWGEQEEWRLTLHVF
jgi:hypothetical protein